MTLIDFYRSRRSLDSITLAWLTHAETMLSFFDQIPRKWKYQSINNNFILNFERDFAVERACFFNSNPFLWTILLILLFLYSLPVCVALWLFLLLFVLHILSSHPHLIHINICRHSSLRVSECTKNVAFFPPVFLGLLFFLSVCLFVRFFILFALVMHSNAPTL